jgi:predicted component of type VI protein secretion system
MKEASTYPLRASVLRRLLDESYDPTPSSPGVLTDLSDSAMKSEEALELGYITPLQLREDLLLDLNYLLQTTRLSTRPLGNRYPEVKASIYYYGLPDRASFGYSASDLGRLGAEITFALRVFEPRLSRIMVDLSDVTAEDSVAVFTIGAELRVPPRPEAVRLAATLPVHSKVLQVKDQPLPPAAQSLHDFYVSLLEE